jgi:hypothetical protein
MGPRGYEINENFFKSWTRDSAWIYGWLLTDGYIGENGQVSLNLKSTDAEVLEKIKATLGFTGEITFYEHSDGRKGSKLRICRKALTEDIFALGMARKEKTFNTVLPNVPDEVFWDLIRGIFEGDGSIRHRTGNTDALDITIAGATKQFMIDLQSALEQRGIFMRLTTRKANSCSGNKHEMYTLNTKSNKDALRLCYFMYARTDDCHRLSRKYNVFENYINTYYDKVKRKSAQCNELVELARQTIVKEVV